MYFIYIYIYIYIYMYLEDESGGRGGLAGEVGCCWPVVPDRLRQKRHHLRFRLRN